MSEGFIRAGFKPIAHVEMDEAACFTLKTRVAYHYLKSKGQINFYQDYLSGKISRSDLYSKVPSHLLESVINLPIGPEFNTKIYKKIEEQLKGKKVDLIIGGPPCQAYSLVGRSRSVDKMVGDPRNFLYVQYAKFLEKYKPKIFVFENVSGLKSAGKGVYLKNMETLFLKKGYNIQLFTIEANNFGVLQQRKRIIIIGWLKDKNLRIPNLEAVKINKGYIVSHLFEDLPILQAGQGIERVSNYTTNRINKCLKDSSIRKASDILTLHVARPHTEQDKEIYRIAVNLLKKGERLNYSNLPIRLKTHSNQHSFFDRFKVVNGNSSFSQTVVAHISKDGHYYIHPDIKQNRSITVREAARLQSFPDDFYFEGFKEEKNRTAAFKQIGNAVPPLMAYKIGHMIKINL